MRSARSLTGMTWRRTSSRCSVLRSYDAMMTGLRSPSAIARNGAGSFHCQSSTLPWPPSPISTYSVLPESGNWSRSAKGFSLLWRKGFAVARNCPTRNRAQPAVRPSGSACRRSAPAPCRRCADCRCGRPARSQALTAAGRAVQPHPTSK